MKKSEDRFPPAPLRFAISQLFALLAWTVALTSVAAANQSLPAHPELKSHTAHFEKKIYKVSDNVYSAVGWGLANTIMVEGQDGIIIVDTGEDIVSAREVQKEFRKISTKPVKAIIYTHFHPDHISGVKAFASQEQVDAGEVMIVAHSTLLDNVINQGGQIGPILGIRTGYTSGVFLSEDENEGMNLGIGPRPNVGRATFIAPTHTYDSRKVMSISGVEFELRHVPSEAPDETAVYLPRNNILLSGETIQGPTLPNIHTLRGTHFRDPVRWYRSIDVLRTYKAEHLVPAHGQPILGATRVEEVLRMTRDGIQFVHDQTIRHMNKGLTPDELAHIIEFPVELKTYSPYLREYYGTIKHAVRQIYNGYLGWFSGDPIYLNPAHPIDSASRHVEAMGGRQKVLGLARSAHDEGDYQWAGELATYLIRIDKTDMESRLLKASSFRHLASETINANWRNWYLTSAHELDGSLDTAKAMSRLVDAISSKDLLNALPIDESIAGLSTRLRAEKVKGLNAFVTFDVTDTEQAFGLEIRNGIAQFHREGIDRADTTFFVTKSVLQQLLAGSLSVSDAVRENDALVTGDKSLSQEFFTYFDKPTAINLTLR